MEAQSQKSSGQNLNPLAPAQSKRTFALWKNLKFHRTFIHSSCLFLSFLGYVSDLFQKSKQRIQGLVPEPQKCTKMDPKGAQTEPKNQQTEAQDASKY